MIKRVLVGLGGTPFTPVAIRQAVEIAARRDAELTGVTLVDVSSAAVAAREEPESGAQFHSQLLEIRDLADRIERSIAQFHELAETAGVKRRNVVLENAEPFSKLTDLARFHDLIVCGLKKLLKYEFAHEKPLDTLVRFMTSGVQPLLSVHDAYRPIRRALIAFSGSAESTRSMKRFVQMKLFPGVVLRVVTFGEESVARPLAEAAAVYCRAHGYEVEARTNPAAAKDALPAEAESYEADIIVLGSSARKTFIRRMLGDTAMKIISGAKVPLFVCQ